MLVTIAEHRCLDKNRNDVIEYGIMEGADLRQVDSSGVGIRVCETSEEVFRALEHLSKGYPTDTGIRKEFNKICREIWEGQALELKNGNFKKR